MRYAALLLSFSAFCTLAAAQAPSPAPASAPNSGIADIATRSRATLDSANAALPPGSTPSSAKSIDIATDIANRSKRGTVAPMPERFTPGMERAAEMARSVNIPKLGQHRPNEFTKAQAVAGASVYLFISQSQSDSDLKSALESAAASGATVYLRGILPGSTLDKGMLRVQQIGKTLSPLPDVRIDPRPFEQFGVDTVPTVVVANSTSHYVKVGGIVSFDYARRRLEEGASGDLGRRGQVLPIAEPDLIAEFQSRILAVDWEAKKKAAAKRMFHSMGIVSLPKATESATRLVDPTVELANDIAMPDGQLIAHAGSRFNPLKAFGFSRQVVFFDATAPDQLAYAKRLADAALATNQITVLITSELDRDRGMEAFREVAVALRPHKIFLLDEVVRQRLDVRVVPTVVVREGDFMRLREVGPEDLK